MVKVFFADGGTLEQLQATLRAIAAEADARLVELEAKAVENASGGVPFPERLHLNTVGLRFIVDHERTTGEWARWALEQSAQWTSATDPGEWDYRRVFPEHDPPPRRRQSRRDGDGRLAAGRSTPRPRPVTVVNGYAIQHTPAPPAARNTAANANEPVLSWSWRRSPTR